MITSHADVPPGIALPSSGQGAWLAGAGISLDLPSGFPLAGDIINALVEVIGNSESGAEVLGALAWPDKDEQRGPTDFLRFELLMEAVQSVADEDLTVLDFIGELHRPNVLHHFLAERAVDGDFLLTTNFDGFIEIALVERGEKPLTICTAQDFGTGVRELSGIPVIKLHGSYNRYKGEEVSASKSTIQATLTTVSRGTSEGLLPQPARNALLDTIHGRTLVVIGYSGMDDFDIIPTLRIAEPTYVLWVDHADEAASDVTSIVKKDIEQKPISARSPRDMLFLDLLKLDRLQVMRGRTTELLGLDVSSNSGNRFDFHEFATSWAKRTLDPVRRPLIIGSLLYRLARFVNATKWLHKAWQNALKLNTSQQVIAAAGRAYARVLLERGRAPEALRVAEATLDMTDVDLAPTEWADCAHAVGFTQYKMGKKQLAGGWYQRALDVAPTDSTVRADCLHDLALIRQDRGMFDKAWQLYQQSRSISDRAGDIRHRSWSEYQMGTIAYDLGDLEEAEQMYVTARKTAELIGDYNHVSTCLHGLALVAQTRGDLGLAARLYRETIRLDVETGHVEYTGVAWQSLGMCFLECERVRTAEQLFARAEKAYEAADDNEAIGELWAYWAWARWEAGDKVGAHTFASRAVERTAQDGVPEYVIWAQFMKALTQPNYANVAAMTTTLEKAEALELITTGSNLALAWARSGVSASHEAATLLKTHRDRCHAWGNGFRVRLLDDFLNSHSHK